MPPVLAAVATGVLYGASGATFFGLSAGLAAGLAAGASSLVLGYASAALTPKPKLPTSTFTNSSGGLTQTVRQAVAAQKLIYGQTRVGGSLVYVGMTGNNKFLHMVIALAGHEVAGIDEVWVNDYVIPPDWLDDNGMVTQGRYANVMRIRKNLGSSLQAADSVMTDEISEWTSAHRLANIAYLYVRLEYNQDKYPGGIPNITAMVRGRRIFDPRYPDASPAFTTNGALFLYDYLSNPRYGLGVADDIDMDVLIASANICDEIVPHSGSIFTVNNVSVDLNTLRLTGDISAFTIGDELEISSTGDVPVGLSENTSYYVIPYQFKTFVRIRLATSLRNAMLGIAVNITDMGSGTITVTKTGMPRYHGGGVIDTASILEDNIKDLLTTMGGRAIYVGGKWLVKAAAYEAPVFELTESDMISAITVRTRLARQDRMTGIKGVYRSSINFDNPSDYPPMDSTLYASIDGEEIWREMDLPFCQRPIAAQRIAKIELLKSRQEIVVRVTCTLRALQVQCGDTIMLTSERFGWEQKEFEVTHFSLAVSAAESAGLAVTLELRETAEAVFDWATSEESAIDPAPNTQLPDPFEVGAVTGVSFDSRPVSTLASDTIYIIGMAWDPHPDQFVTDGGQFELQFKRSSDSTWRPSFFVNGALSFSDIFQASAGDAYDVRIRAVNNIGVRSAWVTLANVIVGSGGGVGESEDWGSFSDSVEASEDWGAFTDSVDTSENWGAFV